MPKYYIITASKDHIEKGILNKFIQQKHPNRIEKLKKGDRVVLYASKESYGKSKSYQKFIAIAECIDNKYEKLEKIKNSNSCKSNILISKQNTLISKQHSLISKQNTPISKGKDDLFFFRKKVRFIKFQEVSIKPMIKKLSFIQNKQYWGMAFMSGFREISHEDYKLIVDS